MSYSNGRILLSSQREGQVSRFRAWVLFAVPLAAIGFHLYVPLFFPQLRFMEMPLLVVVYFALMRRSQISGLLVGAGIGLVQDSLTSKSPLGMFGIVNTLVGYFAASVGLKLDVDHPLIRFLLSFFFYLFHQVFYWVLARALLGQQVALNMQQILVLGLLNAIIGAALFHFLDRLRERS
jgi:rod shape-determining protein MreD